MLQINEKSKRGNKMLERMVARIASGILAGVFSVAYSLYIQNKAEFILYAENSYQQNDKNEEEFG